MAQTFKGNEELNQIFTLHVCQIVSELRKFYNSNQPQLHEIHHRKTHNLNMATFKLF